MSSTCGNCDCADKNQCVKKSNGFDVVVISTEKRYATEVMEFSDAGSEHGGKCKCGPNCSCTDCNCGD